MSKIGDFFGRMLPGRKRKETPGADTAPPAPPAPLETNTRSYQFPKDSVFLHGVQTVQGRFPNGDMAPGTLQYGPPVMPPELGESVELRSGYTITEDPKLNQITISDTKNGGTPAVIPGTMSVDPETGDVTLTNTTLTQQIHPDGSFALKYPSYYVEVNVAADGNPTGRYAYFHQQRDIDCTTNDKGVITFKYSQMGAGYQDIRLKPFLTHAQLVGS